MRSGAGTSGYDGATAELLWCHAPLAMSRFPLGPVPSAIPRCWSLVSPTSRPSRRSRHPTQNNHTLLLPACSLALKTILPARIPCSCSLVPFMPTQPLNLSQVDGWWRVAADLTTASSATYRFTLMPVPLTTPRWKVASGGKFGYSVQRDIWIQQQKRWSKFIKQLDWVSGENNIYRKWPGEFNYTQDAPRGHLPLTNALRGTQVGGGEDNMPSKAQGLKEWGWPPAQLTTRSAGTCPPIKILFPSPARVAPPSPRFQ